MSAAASFDFCAPLGGQLRQSGIQIARGGGHLPGRDRFDVHDDEVPPGRFDTRWGDIEFTHTDRDIEPEIDVYPRDNGALEASVERARDLRRVGRNTDPIDEEVLAGAPSEQRVIEQQGRPALRNPSATS
jgi:hypothetical protein